MITPNRPFLVYDGKPYRRAEMTRDHASTETTLKVYAYPFEIHVRVSDYTVEMRQSGRYVYFVRGRETLRKAMPLRMPKPSQELLDIMAVTA